MKVKVLSLFSGAGGLDIGFLKAGFDIVATLEIDEACCKTIHHNKGKYFANGHNLICGDITKIDPGSIGVHEIDFIIGGPPCQSFSAAGRRAGGVCGTNDARGSLFEHYCRYIKHFRPKGFLFENVRGLLQANQGEDLKKITDAFSSLGYKLHFRVLDAADYGVPQHRERLIIVGLLEGEYLFPRPLYGLDSVDERPHIGVGEAIADLDDPNEVVPPMGGKYSDMLPEIPPGLNYLYFTEKMGHPNPKFAWRSRFSDFLYKAHPDTPCKTIVASQGKWGGPFHWKNRKFTIQELKRIQSFPDDYVIYGSYLVQAKQIGNSVAPKFAEWLAKAVMHQIFDPTAFEGIELLHPGETLSFDGRKGRKAQKTRGLVAKLNGAPLCQARLSDNYSINKASTERDIETSWVYKAPRQRAKGDTHADEYPRYNVACKLRSGVWNAKVIKEPLNANRVCNITLELKFKYSVGGEFNKIVCTLITDDIWEVSIAWDAIDEMVRQGSSYENIHPLYGHFTEPYPQFILETIIGGKYDPEMATFLQKVSNFSYLRDLHPLNELKDLFSSFKEPLLVVRKLRAHGYDIRVNQTNKAIPVDHFRCVYPYTISLNAFSFVSWDGDIDE